LHGDVPIFFPYISQYETNFPFFIFSKICLILHTKRLLKFEISPQAATQLIISARIISIRLMLNRSWWDMHEIPYLKGNKASILSCDPIVGVGKMLLKAPKQNPKSKASYHICDVFVRMV